MPTLIKLADGRYGAAEDVFTTVADEDAIPEGPVILSLTRFQAEGDALLSAGRPVGVRILPDEAIEDLAYDLQMAHLALGHEDRHGRPPTEVGVIAFEWEEPFDCCLLVMDEQDLAIGRERREEAFRRIAECQASGHWPSHGRQPFRPVSIGSRSAEPEAVAMEALALF